MRIKLIFIGISQEEFVKIGIEKYYNRLKHYADVEILEILNKNGSKLSTENQIKNYEGELILRKVEKSDYIILLDENGVQYSSVDFSKQIQKFQISGYKNIVFIIGGAYGFSKEIYDKANIKISLSKMTFTHQFARLILIEQLY